MTRLQSIERISAALKTIPEAEVFVFGSSARGDFKKSSDIDLLILLSDSLTVSQRIEKELEIQGLLWPIEMESGFDISPIILQHKVWNQRKTPFTINVCNDRIRI